jgi:hypothetical protein
MILVLIVMIWSDSNQRFDLSLFLKILPFIIIISYTLNQQIVKKFILFEDELVLVYPLRFIYRSKRVKFKDVERFEFNENPGGRKVPFITVIYQHELGISKQKFEFSNAQLEIQTLIDNIRILGVPIDVVSKSGYYK